jgi:3-deoxy-D-manno-octulosonic acid kinase
MRRQLGSLPPGYVVHRVGATWLVLDERVTGDLVRLRLADPAVRDGLFARARRRGRGTTPTVAVNPETQVILRRYRHGGLLAWLTGPLFLGPSRALKELEITARAEALGAPVPHALLVILWPVLGPLWSALIGTRMESQATDLLESLSNSRERVARQRLLREVGAAVRRLHDAGVEHRDLQLRNILVTREETRRIVAVDLDRARFRRQGTLSASQRARNLGRLARSAVKAGLFEGILGKREVAAFVAAYTGSDRALREELRGYVALEWLKLQAHRLTYPLRRIS